MKMLRLENFITGWFLMGMIIQYVIRLAAAMCAVSLVAMLAGWSDYSDTTLMIDVMFIIVWAWSEYDLKKAKKKKA